MNITNKDYIVFACGCALGAIVSYYITRRKTQKECYEEYMYLNSEETEDSGSVDQGIVIRKDDEEFNDFRKDVAQKREEAKKLAQDLQYVDPTKEDPDPYVIEHDTYEDIGYEYLRINYYPAVDRATNETDESELDWRKYFTEKNAEVLVSNCSIRGQAYGYVRDDANKRDIEVFICYAQWPIDDEEEGD